MSRPRRRLALVLALLAACAAWAVAALSYRAATQVTFSRDVAPIGLAHCAPCHRPGQTAPFSLLTYADYREHAEDIAWVVADHYMPPWKPSDRNGRFLGDRSLDDEQIALIERWLEQGAPEGDRGDLPPPPKWPAGWQLGTPDLIVRVAEPYPLAPAGPDEYRSFVIPAPVRDTRYVVGWEFKPGTRAIHHAILKIDRMGNARRADAADLAPGFAAVEFDGAQAPDGFYLVWAPGKEPKRAIDGSAWRIDAGTDLLLQLHLQRSGKAERVDPQIALYFSDAPPTVRRYTLRIGDLPIDIAPGEKRWRMTDAYTLPVAVRVLGMFPHAHFLARTMRVWSRAPNGAVLELLRIDDWDFNWQDEYAYAKPPLLPAGSTLEMEFVYDNSADNTRNPNQPPRRVRNGPQSTDEMGNVTFQVALADAADTNALLESKYRRQLARGPGAEAHYNLANTLAKQGRQAEAIEHYEQAVALQPQLAPAHVNLAGVLLARGDAPAAVAHLQAALALKPEDGEARLMLGSALLGMGKAEAALVPLQRAAQEQPGRAMVRLLLGDALLARGQRDLARAEYAAALRLEPSSARARAGLAAAERGAAALPGR